MLLAELIVRHTRRHMPTRRVALESAYLPTSGPAHGVALLAAVVATNLPAVDDDERELLAAPGRTTRAAASRSRASRCATGCSATCTVSTGRATAARRGRPARARARRRTARRSRRCSARCWARRGCRQSGRDGRARRAPPRGRRPMGRSRARRRAALRRARHVGLPAAAAGGGRRVAAGRSARGRGLARASPPTSAGRWKCSACAPGMDVDRDDVNRRFRRLLRDAHPDSGGAARRGGVAHRRAHRSPHDPARIWLRPRSPPRASFRLP